MYKSKYHNILFISIISLLIILAILICSILYTTSTLEKDKKVHYYSYKLAEELKHSSDNLTRYCRVYVLTGDSIWENRYWDVLDVRNGVKPWPNGRLISLQDSLQNLGITGYELNLLIKAEKNSNDLVNTEKTAFNAMKGIFADSAGVFSNFNEPDTAFAQRLMFDEKYHLDKDSIMQPIGVFFEMLDNRIQRQEAKLNKTKNTLLYSIIQTIIIIAGLSFYGILVLRKQVTRQLLELKKLNNTLDQKIKSRTDLLETKLKELKEVNHELEVTEERYRFLTNSTFEGIVVHKDGILIDCNNSFLEKIGYSKDELIRMDLIKDAIFKDDVHIIYEKIKNHVNAPFVARVVRKDGSLFWCEMESKEVVRNNETVRIVAARDVTDKVNLQKKLKENEQKLENLLDNLPGMAYTSINNKDWDLVYLSSGCYDLLEYTPDEFINNPNVCFNDLIVPEDQEYVWTTVQKALDSNSPFELEYRIKTKSGTIKWVWEKGKKVTIDGKNFLEGFINDITDKKVTSEKLKEINYDLKWAQKTGKIGTWYANLNSNEFWGSEQTINMYGFTTGKPVTADIVQMVHMPEYRDRLNTSLQNLIFGLAPYEETFKLRNQTTGEIIDVYSIAQYFSETNEIKGIIQDISKIKKAEEDIHKFKTIADKSLYGSVITNLDTTIIYVNEYFAHTHGYEPHELIGKTITAFHSDDQLIKVQKILERTIKKGKIKAFELNHIKKDGTEFPMLMSAATIPDELGNPLFLGATAFDLTEIKEAQNALKKSESKYKALFDGINDAIFVLTIEGTSFGQFIEVNDVACKRYGYTRRELLNMNLQDISRISKTNPNDAEKAIKAILEKKMYLIETVHITKDGTELPVEISLRLFQIEKKPVVITLVRDITERKNAAEKIHQMAQNFTNIFNESTDTLMILDYDAKLIEINKTFVERNGYSRDEIIGKSIKIIDPTINKEALMGMLNKLTQKNSILTFESVHKTKSGRVYPVEINSKLMTYYDKKVVLTTARDITERVNNLKVIKENEAKFRSFFENKGIATIIINKQGLIRLCNEQFCRMSGYNLKETQNKISLKNLIKPNDHHKLNDLLTLDKRFYHSPSKSIELSFICKDKNHKYILLNHSHLPNGEQSIITLLDITTRKINERLNSVQLKLIDLSLHQNISNLLINFLNEAEAITNSLIGFYHFVDEDQEQILLQQWSSNTLKDYCKTIPTSKHYPISKAGIWADCIKIRKPVIHNNYKTEKNKKGLPSGHAQVIREIVVPVIRGNKIKAILGVGNKPTNYTEADMKILQQMADLAWEIIDRKNAEIQLNEYKEHLELLVKQRTADLEASNKEMEAFTYSVSHDLRAPLRAINGYSGFLKEDYDTVLDDEGKRYLNVIQENSTKMNQLISDLLKLSRTSRTELEMIKIDMKAIAWSMFMEVASKKEQDEFELIVKDIPEIEGDPTSIKQLWTNLIGNAIKYSSKSQIKKIEIGCSKRDHNQTTYYIKDYGCGFKPEYQHKIFEIFQRLHSESEYAGTGVGLAIVKRIIDKHNGSIRAESMPNEGTTFYFTLPTNLKN